MSQRINTGNYRICKEQIGIAKTKEVLHEGSLDETSKQWGQMERNSGYTYYKEEEVFYRGTQFNESGLPVDSAPTWVRMN